MLYFIIDGYNLIKRNHKFDGDTLPKSRRKVLLFIRRYADLRKERFIVVFDGKEGVAYSHTENEGIKVKFSQAETADDYIKKIVSRHRHSNQLVVVSDDKDIVEFARRKRARIFSTRKFILEMEKKDRAEKELPEINLKEANQITEELQRILERKYNRYGG